jgi:hypothetical protein
VIRLNDGASTAANGPRSSALAPQLRYEISLELAPAASLRTCAEAVVVKNAAVAKPSAIAVRAFRWLRVLRIACSSLGFVRTPRGSGRPLKRGYSVR